MWESTWVGHGPTLGQWFPPNSFLSNLAGYGTSKSVNPSSSPPSAISPTPQSAVPDNGFVRACFHAYSNHHHLTLRPEDIWFAILTQLSFHINAHAEDLRSFFVTHEGREELEVFGAGTIKTADFGPLAVKMTKEMDKFLVDPDLRQWVMLDFTTTTDTDTVTAAVLMMGAMQEYFSYKMTLCCGIPSITLLGERDDWVKIQRRLDKLPQLGPEPEIFARLLRPVLEYFVRSFDSPNDTWSAFLLEQNRASKRRLRSPFPVRLAHGILFLGRGREVPLHCTHRCC